MRAAHRFPPHKTFLTNRARTCAGAWNASARLNFSHHKETNGVIWWVAYQRGSFSLKERYACAQHAHQRCGHLFTRAQYLRIIADTDIEGRAALAHCFELPPVAPQPVQ
jgi:hypothetical protein